MKRVSPIFAVRGSDALFPNDFGEDLLLRLLTIVEKVKLALLVLVIIPINYLHT